MVEGRRDSRKKTGKVLIEGFGMRLLGRIRPMDYKEFSHNNKRNKHLVLPCLNLGFHFRRRIWDVSPVKGISNGMVIAKLKEVFLTFSGIKKLVD